MSTIRRASDFNFANPRLYNRCNFDTLTGIGHRHTLRRLRALQSNANPFPCVYEVSQRPAFGFCFNIIFEALGERGRF